MAVDDKDDECGGAYGVQAARALEPLETSGGVERAYASGGAADEPKTGRLFQEGTRARGAERCLEVDVAANLAAVDVEAVSRLQRPCPQPRPRVANSRLLGLLEGLRRRHFGLALQRRLAGVGRGVRAGEARKSGRLAGDTVEAREVLRTRRERKTPQEWTRGGWCRTAPWLRAVEGGESVGVGYCRRRVLGGRARGGRPHRCCGEGLCRDVDVDVDADAQQMPLFACSHSPVLRRELVRALPARSSASSPSSLCFSEACWRAGGGGATFYGWVGIAVSVRVVARRTWWCMLRGDVVDPRGHAHTSWAAIRDSSSTRPAAVRLQVQPNGPRLLQFRNCRDSTGIALCTAEKETP
ncbi:hypothetical protein C8J57DRAFT_1241947 [Mycena rebaudengoi]|nr:hypothetical protein C8J57DRAFT_1241947 [Mycena rebaudengoi]